MCASARSTTSRCHTPRRPPARVSRRSVAGRGNEQMAVSLATSLQVRRRRDRRRAAHLSAVKARVTPPPARSSESLPGAPHARRASAGHVTRVAGEGSTRGAGLARTRSAGTKTFFLLLQARGTVWRECCWRRAGSAALVTGPMAGVRDWRGRTAVVCVVSAPGQDWITCYLKSARSKRMRAGTEDDVGRARGLPAFRRFVQAP